MQFFQCFFPIFFVENSRITEWGRLTALSFSVLNYVRVSVWCAKWSERFCVEVFHEWLDLSPYLKRFYRAFIGIFKLEKQDNFFSVFFQFFFQNSRITVWGRVTAVSFLVLNCVRVAVSFSKWSETFCVQVCCGWLDLLPYLRRFYKPFIRIFKLQK